MSAVRASILCVDDEPVVLASLRRQLREISPNHRIEVAASGREALEVFTRAKADGREIALLISDQQMPGMAGDALLAQAAVCSPGTYQVMLTGQATAEAVGRAVNNGRLFRFLSKPWSVEDLQGTVQMALTAHARDAELARHAAALDRAHRRSLDFVPHAYLRMLGRERLEDVERGDAIAARVTVFFADIRGFTTLIESMSPRQSFDFVNRYFLATDPAIRDNGGFIDHYAGDGTLAIFPGEPSDAVRAAIAFSRAVEALNLQREAEGEAALDIGIGLHCGDVVMGVSGGGNSLQCGVIGDPVNLAARMEGLTTRYGARLLVSEDVRSTLDDTTLTLRRLERVRAKGKREAVTVHEVLDALPAEVSARRCATLTSFLEAVEAMQRGDTLAALSGFARVVEADATDRAAHLLLDTCHDRLRGRQLPDATGVTSLSEKTW
jgi:class 3 adenylate cyclase